MQSRHITALIAGALLIVGPFCPVVSLPIVGDMTYFRNGEGDGTIVVLLGIATLALAMARKYQMLWLTGLASTGMAIFTFVQLKQKISEFSNSISTDLKDNPFRALAEVAAHAVQIKWGLAVIVVGGVLAVVAANMRDESAGKV